jgi:hypothetical protein
MQRANHYVGSYPASIRLHLGRMLTAMGLVIFCTSAMCVLRPSSTDASAEHMQSTLQDRYGYYRSGDGSETIRRDTHGTSIDCHNCTVVCVRDNNRKTLVHPTVTPIQISFSSVMDQVKEGTNRRPSQDRVLQWMDVSGLLHLKWGSSSVCQLLAGIYLWNVSYTSRILAGPKRRPLAHICQQESQKRKKESHVSLTHFAQMQAKLQMAMMGP